MTPAPIDRSTSRALRPGPGAALLAWALSTPARADCGIVVAQCTGVHRAETCLSKLVETAEASCLPGGGTAEGCRAHADAIEAYTSGRCTAGKPPAFQGGTLAFEVRRLHLVELGALEFDTLYEVQARCASIDEDKDVLLASVAPRAEADGTWAGAALGWWRLAEALRDNDDDQLFWASGQLYDAYRSEGDEADRQHRRASARCLASALPGTSRDHAAVREKLEIKLPEAAFEALEAEITELCRTPCQGLAPAWGLARPEPEPTPRKQNAERTTVSTEDAKAPPPDDPPGETDEAGPPPRGPQRRKWIIVGASGGCSVAAGGVALQNYFAGQKAQQLELPETYAQARTHNNIALSFTVAAGTLALIQLALPADASLSVTPHPRGATVAVRF